MSGEWAPKRFWTDATVEAEEGAYGVRLDGRPVRTPSKSPLTLPTRALAEALAAEFAAQGEKIDPRTMPMTRTANSAIDKVVPQQAEVVAHLAGYGETDLLCYRADGPDELVRRQAEAWDPWLDWLDSSHNARLVTVQGVIPVDQDPAALAKLRAEVLKLTVFELAAFHDLVSLPGSLVLALAVTKGHANPAEIWETSRIDECWQIEQWGEDEEAERVNALKKLAFSDSAQFFELARQKR